MSFPGWLFSIVMSDPFPEFSGGIVREPRYMDYLFLDLSGGAVLVSWFLLWYWWRKGKPNS